MTSFTSSIKNSTTENILREIGNHQFIFVGGLHRSGTSILFRSLKEHPAISGFNDTGVSEDEGQLLQTVYPPAMDYGGPGKFGFYQQMHLTEDSDLVNESNRILLYQQWASYWDISRCYLLEKSPPNLIKTRFLQAIFSSAKFIILLRHPVAVSLATKKWSKTTLDSLIQHWLICHETYQMDESNLNSVFRLKYHDFVEKPLNVLNQIYDFIGVKPVGTSLKVRSNINEKYFRQWDQMRNKILLRKRIQHIIDKYEDRVQRFGYSLVNYS